MIEAAIMCLALNIYHEARGESIAGQIAVAQVTMHRKESTQYPDTVCGVVKQGKYKNGIPVLYKCQFSWWCDGKSDEAKNEEQWEQSKELAEKVYFGYIPDIVEGALHYHATSVNPYWASSYSKVVQIDNHIFYK